MKKVLTVLVLMVLAVTLLYAQNKLVMGVYLHDMSQKDYDELGIKENYGVKIDVLVKDGPADMAGLKERGRLKERNVADIVIFNPETINDPATFNEPHQYSRGIEYLFVNGDIVISRGQYNGNISGKPLKITN